MKIKPGQLDPLTVPRKRGTFVMQITEHAIYARAWPKPRKGPDSPQQIWWQKQFGIAGRMAANPIDIDYGTAVEMVKGTTLVPRDALTQSAYGRFYRVQGPDGYVWPIADHGPPWLQPTPEPETEEMMWIAPSASPYSNGSIQAWDNATKGMYFQPYIDLKVRGILVMYPSQITAQDHRVTIADWTMPDTMGAILAMAAQNVTSDPNRQAWFPLSVDLEAGKDYCVLLTRTDGSATFNLPVYLQSWSSPCPWYTSRVVRASTLDPQASQTFTTTTWGAVAFTFKIGG